MEASIWWHLSFRLVSLSLLHPHQAAINLHSYILFPVFLHCLPSCFLKSPSFHLPFWMEKREGKRCCRRETLGLNACHRMGICLARLHIKITTGDDRVLQRPCRLENSLSMHGKMPDLLLQRYCSYFSFFEMHRLQRRERGITGLSANSHGNKRNQGHFDSSNNRSDWPWFWPPRKTGRSIGDH